MEIEHAKKEVGLNVHSKIFALFGDSFLFSYIQPVWNAPRNPTKMEVPQVGNNSIEKKL